MVPRRGRADARRRDGVSQSLLLTAKRGDRGGRRLQRRPGAQANQRGVRGNQERSQAATSRGTRAAATRNPARRTAARGQSSGLRRGVSRAEYFEPRQLRARSGFGNSERRPELEALQEAGRRKADGRRYRRRLRDDLVRSGIVHRVGADASRREGGGYPGRSRKGNRRDARCSSRRRGIAEGQESRAGAIRVRAGLDHARGRTARNVRNARRLPSRRQVPGGNRQGDRGSSPAGRENLFGRDQHDRRRAGADRRSAAWGRRTEGGRVSPCSRRGRKGKEGLAELTARCLSQGPKELTAPEFDQKVDFMGSSVGVSAGRDYSTAAMTTLKKYQGDTLKLLAGILTEPGLREADIERKRGEQVAEIKSAEEQPGYTADVEFTKDLFGDSPYGHPGEGSSESAGKLSADDVRGFYRANYKLGSAIIAVAGDVAADEVKVSLEKEPAALSGSVAPQAQPPPITVAPGLHAKLIDRNVVQANIIMGCGGVARSNPDFYRLKVMNYILGGGGFSSRLVKVVRSEHGLAYSVTSSFEPGKFQGAFSISLQTKNQSSNQAIDLILQQLREIQEKPVSDAELDGAKKFLIGSFPLGLERQSAIASFMVQVEFYGLGLDYAEQYPKLIGSVTKDEVLAVAKKYLHPDSMIVVAAANQSEAKIKTSQMEKAADAASAQ